MQRARRLALVFGIFGVDKFYLNWIWFGLLKLLTLGGSQRLAERGHVLKMSSDWVAKNTCWSAINPPHEMMHPANDLKEERSNSKSRHALMVASLNAILVRRQQRRLQPLRALRALRAVGVVDKWLEWC